MCDLLMTSIRRYKCSIVDPHISLGRFRQRQIRTMAGAQRQIRNYGGVMTRLNVFPDFNKFFKAYPTGVYTGEMCIKGVVNDSETVIEHAVVLVGYDNIKEFCES